MDIIPDVSKTQLSPAVFLRRLAAGVLLLNLFVATLIFLSLRVSDYPLSIHVGLAAQDYLAPWQSEVIKISAAAATLLPLHARHGAADFP